MLAGLPVVAARVSAVPEIVLHDETGLLVTPGDVDATAAGLSALLRDPALRTRLVEAGRERVRTHFSVDQMTSRTIAVYEAALR